MRCLDLGNPKTLDDPTLADVQRRLLDEKVHMNNIGSSAGCRFRDATFSCLKGATAFDVGNFEDETNEHVAARVSKGFYLHVLRLGLWKKYRHEIWEVACPVLTTLITVPTENQTARCPAPSHNTSNFHSTWPLTCVRLYHTLHDFLQRPLVFMFSVVQRG